MDSSKHLSNVALFPLCDVHNVLMETLCDKSDKPGTRADALLLAWRFALPDGIAIDKAADAVLAVAMSIPRKAWSERQLLIVRELMVLAGRKGSVPRVERVDHSRLGVKHPRRRSADERVDRDVLAEFGLIADQEASTDDSEPKLGHAQTDGDLSVEQGAMVDQDAALDIELTPKSTDSLVADAPVKAANKWWKRVRGDALVSKSGKRKTRE